MPRMGDLAATDVYSAFDVPPEQTYDRRLDQTWPGRLAQEAIGAVLAPGRALQSTEPITTEQMIKPAADLAGLVTGGSYAAPAQKGASGAGIRAYHSSPHDFDKFDLAKIGTGEGAQAYGHGLYFAESPAVSGQGGQYWQQFKGRALGEDPAAHKAMEYLQSYGFDRQKAAEGIDKFLKHGINKDNARAVAEHTAARDLLASGGQVGPRTYEVNINADPAHMLDWDKPLRAQPHIQDVLADKMLADLPGKAGIRNIRRVNEEIDEILGGKSGDILYRKFSTNPREASAFLGEAGIPGIKYLDQGSRALPGGEILGTQQTPQGWISSIRGVHPSAFNGGTIFTKSMPFKTEAEALAWANEKIKTPTTSNYVIFDPGIIDILKKYGIAGAAPVGMGALAAQDTYRE